MKNSSQTYPASTAGMIVLTLLRLGIGWHFLYEGLSKLLDKGWTSAGYLESATDPFAGFFHALSAIEKAGVRQRPWRA